MHKFYDLTILIPAYNEANRIGLTLNTLETVMNDLDVDLRILVVDDGSEDRTLEVLSKHRLSRGELRVISLDTNGGQGSALRRGIEEIETKYFLIVPADNDISHLGIAQLISNTGKANLILGYYGRELTRSRFRKLTSNWYNKLICLILKIRVKYINGPAVYETSVVQSMKLYSQGFTLISEMTSKALHQVETYREVQIQSNPSTSESGRSLSIDTFIQILSMLWRFIFGSDRQVRSNVGARAI